MSIDTEEFYHPVTGELVNNEPEMFNEEAELLPIPKVDYKTKDTDLYNNWAKTKSKRDMTVLVKHLNPLIIKEVNRGVGTLPTTALMGEAKHWAVKAIKTFDPSKGFALSTHVTNYIQRTRRLNYKYQLTARLPEDMRTDYPEYNRAKSVLLEELNEEPTVDQIASRLGWSKAKVQRFNDRVYTDQIESANENSTQVSEYSDNDLRMKHLLSQLTDEERFILRNKGKMSATELASRLGVNTQRLNYVQRKLINKIVLLKQEVGL
jgi:DNA-directed RNA polymerase specialized sigma subunit